MTRSALGSTLFLYRTDPEQSLKRRRVFFLVGLCAVVVWAGWFAPQQALKLASARLAKVAQPDAVCAGSTDSLDAAYARMLPVAADTELMNAANRSSREWPDGDVPAHFDEAWAHLDEWVESGGGWWPPPRGRQDVSVVPVTHLFRLQGLRVTLPENYARNVAYYFNVAQRCGLARDSMAARNLLVFASGEEVAGFDVAFADFDFGIDVWAEWAIRELQASNFLDARIAEASPLRPRPSLVVKALSVIRLAHVAQAADTDEELRDVLRVFPGRDGLEWLDADGSYLTEWESTNALLEALRRPHLSSIWTTRETE